MTLDLGATGIAVGRDDPGADVAAFEASGYQTLWMPGGQIDRLSRITDLVGLAATAKVGTAIISPDVFAADEVGQLYTDLESVAPGRLVIGLGGSQKPTALRELHTYLDQLDRVVPRGRRILAALGPRKLVIARDRCAGAITLLVTPEFTSSARDILGPDATLVVDQFVVLGTDADRARALARGRLAFLAGVPGYRSNFARMGFSDNEIRTLDDHLVDALVAWGDIDAITDRLDAHRTAGADHIVLTLLSEDQPQRMAMARQLAARMPPAGN